MRGGLLALAALVLAPATAAAQQAGDRPVAVADVSPADPAGGFTKYHYIVLDSSRSVSGGGNFVAHQWHLAWHPQRWWFEGYVNKTQIMKAGWQRIGLEVGSVFGPRDIAWKTIFVRDIQPWTGIPWAPRRYGGPRPTYIRGQLLVDDRQPIRRINASGIRLRVRCPRECIVDSALQITAHRARRIGFAGQVGRPRRNLALASSSEAALMHDLRLRPVRAARRALRRRSRVPARVLVVVRALNGATHTIPANVQLLGRRRR